MFGALTPVQRLRRRVEDVLVGLGLAETYTPSLRADDQDPHALDAAGADLRRARRPADAPAPEPRRGGTSEHRARRRRRRAVRDRPRLPARLGDLPDEQHARGRHRRRAAGLARRGSSRRCYAALKIEPRFERTPTSCSIPARPPRSGPASSASSTRACSKASGARSSSTSRSCSRRRPSCATRT